MDTKEYRALMIKTQQAIAGVRIEVFGEWQRVDGFEVRAGYSKLWGMFRFVVQYASDNSLISAVDTQEGSIQKLVLETVPTLFDLMIGQVSILQELRENGVWDA